MVQFKSQQDDELSWL